MDTNILIQKLANLLIACIILAGVAGGIKSIFIGKTKDIIWIVIACLVLIVFVKNPNLFLSLMESLINFVSGIVKSLNLEETKELTN